MRRRDTSAEMPSGTIRNGPRERATARSGAKPCLRDERLPSGPDRGLIYFTWFRGCSSVFLDVGWRSDAIPLILLRIELALRQRYSRRMRRARLGPRGGELQNANRSQDEISPRTSPIGQLRTPSSAVPARSERCDRPEDGSVQRTLADRADRLLTRAMAPRCKSLGMLARHALLGMRMKPSVAEAAGMMARESRERSRETKLPASLQMRPHPSRGGEARRHSRRVSCRAESAAPSIPASAPTLR